MEPITQIRVQCNQHHNTAGTTNTFYRSVVVVVAVVVVVVVVLVLPILVCSIHSFGISDLLILPKGANG